MKIRGCLRPLIGALACLVAPRPARRILLAEGDGSPGRVRFLSLPVELAEGAKSSWVTLTRTGRFTDPRYGEFEITPVMLAQMVSNFEARILGQDVFIDVAHAPNNGAAARVLRLAVEGNRLRALVEWTDYGIEAVRKRGFAYLSAEYHEAWRDNEKGEAHGCVLLAAGLTTRPVIKHLDRVTLSEADPDDEAKLAIHPHLIKTLESAMNKHLEALRIKLLALGLTEAQIKPILDAALKQLEAAAEDEAKCLTLVGSYGAAGEALAAQLKQLGQGGGNAAITLQVGSVDDNAIGAAVAKALAARDTAAAADATTLAAKVKLLSDTVGESKTLSDDAKTAMVDELKPLVTKELSDDQVKGMATYALSQAAKVSAAVQLATLGYRPPSGSVHITVESGNQIKALQVEIDKRLGFAGMSDADRYERTGGKLLDKNKAFAEKALAQYDELNGHRLASEHKLLAAGTGQIGDFAVPAVFERTVLREALYQLTGLSFVDVGNRLEDLAETIRSRGVRQPISVRPNLHAPGRWMLNFGARRLRASKMAGMADIPAFIDTTADSYDQVIENEQRQGLRPLELALFVQKRIALGDNQTEIAKRLGKSRQWVTLAIALIEPPDWLLQAYRDGRCRGINELYELRRLHGEHGEVVEAWAAKQPNITRDRLTELRATLERPAGAAPASVVPAVHSSSHDEATGTATVALLAMKTRPRSSVPGGDTPDLPDSPARSVSPEPAAKSEQRVHVEFEGHDYQLVVSVVPDHAGCMYVRPLTGGPRRLAPVASLKLLGFVGG